MTSFIDNPDTHLKAPREKGEVFPERIKSSRFKEQRKAPNLDGLKSSISTRCAAADRVLHNQTIKTTGKHAIEDNNRQSRRANLKDDDTNKFQFEKAMEILPNRMWAAGEMTVIRIDCIWWSIQLQDYLDSRFA